MVAEVNFSSPAPPAEATFSGPAPLAETDISRPVTPVQSSPKEGVGLGELPTHWSVGHVLPQIPTNPSTCTTDLGRHDTLDHLEFLEVESESEGHHQPHLALHLHMITDHGESEEDEGEEGYPTTPTEPGTLLIEPASPPRSLATLPRMEVDLPEMEAPAIAVERVDVALVWKELSDCRHWLRNLGRDYRMLRRVLENWSQKLGLLWDNSQRTFLWLNEHSPKILRLEEHMVPVVQGIENDVDKVKVELETLRQFRVDVGQHVQELREWQTAVETGTGSLFHATNQKMAQLEEQVTRLFTHLTSLEQRCNQGFGELASDSVQMKQEMTAFERQVEQGRREGEYCPPVMGGG